MSEKVHLNMSPESVDHCVQASSSMTEMNISSRVTTFKYVSKEGHLLFVFLSHAVNQCQALALCMTHNRPDNELASSLVLLQFSPVAQALCWTIGVQGWCLTHRGSVTQYCGRSILCKKTYIFHYERIPPNLRCCNFFKVDIIIFENPLQKLRIFTFWLFLGWSLWRKNQKKNHIFRGCGEKTAITRLILRLAP